MSVLNTPLKAYLNQVSPSSTFHDDDAYDKSGDLSKLNSKKTFDDEVYTTILVNQFSRNGIDFELLEEVHDRSYLKYVKHDINGDVSYRDGKVQYKTQEELIEEMGEKRFLREHVIRVKKDKTIVARTMDEWGCLLSVVAPEYRGMGLASELIKQQITKQPFRNSGGYTEGGYATRVKQYQSLIRKALASGYYSKSIRNGDLTIERVKEILQEAKISSTPTPSSNRFSYLPMPKRSNKFTQLNKANLNCSSPENLLLYVESSTAILYDKTFFELTDNKSLSDEQVEYFTKQCIKGYVFVGGSFESNVPQKIFNVYSHNKQTEELMHIIALNLNCNEHTCVDWAQFKLIEALPSLASKIEVGANQDNFIVKLLSQTINLGEISKIERLIRGTYDNPHLNTKLDRLHELAYSLSLDFDNIRHHENEPLNFEAYARLEELRENTYLSLSKPDIQEPTIEISSKTKKHLICPHKQ